MSASQSGKRKRKGPRFVGQKQFEKWWMAWSTDWKQDAALSQFSLDQLALIVGFCEIAWRDGRERGTHGR